MTEMAHILYREFRINLVATPDGVLARIRRIDGREFKIARSLRAATATSPFATEQQALGEAQKIIDRIARNL